MAHCLGKDARKQKHLGLAEETFIQWLTPIRIRNGLSNERAAHAMMKGPSTEEHSPGPAAPLSQGAKYPTTNATHAESTRHGVRSSAHIDSHREWTEQRALMRLTR